MSGAASEPDFRSYLNAFFFRSYLTSLVDRRRTAEERLDGQMTIEDLVLSGPPKLFSVFQEGLLDDVLVRDPGVADWFLTFAASLDEERLRVVNLSAVELFWRNVLNRRVRWKAVDLIAKAGAASDPSMAATRGSNLATLFREYQKDLFALPLHPDAQIIIDPLFWRVKLMTADTLNTEAGRLGRYCLRLVRACYLDEHSKFTPEQLDRVVNLAGPMPDDLRDRVYATLL
jgi:hypothetical protein